MNRKALPHRRPNVTVETLRRFINYDPETGRLTWKERHPEDFPISRMSQAVQARIFNTKSAGKPALSVPDDFGYLSGTLKGRNFMAHRVAWAIYYGEWPDCQIDHINGNPADNRILNLRDVTAAQNSRNRRMLDANTSGFTGVYWEKNIQKWRARIPVNHRMVSLGSFANKDDAIRARLAAQEKMGYAERHGKRAQ